MSLPGWVVQYKIQVYNFRHESNLKIKRFVFPPSLSTVSCFAVFPKFTELDSCYQSSQICVNTDNYFFFDEKTWILPKYLQKKVWNPELDKVPLWERLSRDNLEIWEREKDCLETIAKALFLFLFTFFELLTLQKYSAFCESLGFFGVAFGAWALKHIWPASAYAGFSNSLCWKTHQLLEIKLTSLSCAEKVWTALSNELPPSPFFQAASYTRAVTSHLPFEQLWYNCCFIAYRRVSVRNQKLVFQQPWPKKVFVTGLYYWWMSKESWQDYKWIWTHSSGLKVANWPSGNTRGSIFQPWTSLPPDKYIKCYQLTPWVQWPSAARDMPGMTDLQAS